MKISKRRAVSPVIATVILVAVAITITIAVAYWMGGIAGMYTKFEKVEIQSAVCTTGVNATIGKYWNLNVMLKNSGSSAATLNGLFINDIEVQNYYTYELVNESTTTSMGTTSTNKEMTINVGQSEPLLIRIDADYPAGMAYTSGTTINIKFHSAGGLDYTKVIELI